MAGTCPDRVERSVLAYLDLSLSCSFDLPKANTVTGRQVLPGLFQNSKLGASIVACLKKCVSHPRLSGEFRHTTMKNSFRVHCLMVWLFSEKCLHCFLGPMTDTLLEALAQPGTDHKVMFARSIQVIASVLTASGAVLSFPVVAVAWKCYDQRCPTRSSFSSPALHSLHPLFILFTQHAEAREKFRLLFVSNTFGVPFANRLYKNMCFKHCKSFGIVTHVQLATMRCFASIKNANHKK